MEMAQRVLHIPAWKENLTPCLLNKKGSRIKNVIAVYRRTVAVNPPDY